MTGIEIPFDWPSDWTEWIALLDTWYRTTQLPVDMSAIGINNIETLKTWLLDQGFAVATNTDGTLEILKVEVLDSANSSTSLPVPIDTFQEVAGTAGTIASYSLSKGSWAGIKKAAIVGVVASLFFSQIAPAQEVGQSVQEDLERFLDDYLIPGTDLVKVYIENGIPYIQEDILQGIRERLVALGVYENAGTVPTGVYKVDGNIVDSSTWNLATFHKFPVTFHVETTPAREYTLNKLEIGLNGSATPSYDITDRVRYFTSSYNNVANIYYFVDVGDLYDLGYIVDGQNHLKISGTLNGEPYESSFTSNLYTNTVEYNGVRRTIHWIGNTANGYSPSIVQEQYPVVNPNNLQPVYLAFGTPAGGVQGITATSTLPADSSKTIEDLLPDAWDNKKQLAYPTESNIFYKKNFLPVNIETNNPFDDGTTQSSQDAQEGTVPSDDDTQKDILDSLPDIIRQYMEDTGITGGEAGDSGDTPPAEPSLIDAAGNGLWSIYNPTLAQVNQFGQWLWSSSIIDQIVRMFNSPLDAVIGFHMIYCTPSKAGPEDIMLGYLDSNVPSYVVTNQYVTINCGTVEVPEYYRTALDYTSTKLSLYLPFIGFVPLSTAVCMGSRLEIIYRIDVLTGTCLAQVKVKKENSDAVMYAFPGNCSVQVPLTATTYTGMVSTLVNGVQAGLSLMTGDIIQAAGEAGQMISSGMAGLSGTKQSGALGANAGVLGIRIPYLVITHPVAYDAFEYSKQYGFPLNETVRLSQVRGYTKVKDIHLQGIPCTDDELEMIERLLKDGVIIN